MFYSVRNNVDPPGPIYGYNGLIRYRNFEDNIIERKEEEEEVVIDKIRVCCYHCLFNECFRH